jgi:hypothetical protein
MAARVGDRNLPTVQRLKALEIVEKIWGKYEKIQGFNKDSLSDKQRKRLEFLRNKAGK